MTNQTNPVKILVVGCGNMRSSHALAYHQLDGFEICGLVSIGKSNEVWNDKWGGGYTLYDNYEEALESTRPDAACTSTSPDTHETYAIKAVGRGCHVFIETPLADTVEGSVRVRDA